jgi:hypothetical protein
MRLNSVLRRHLLVPRSGLLGFPLLAALVGLSACKDDAPGGPGHRDAGFPLGTVFEADGAIVLPSGQLVGNFPPGTMFELDGAIVLPNGSLYDSGAGGGIFLDAGFQLAADTGPADGGPGMGGTPDAGFPPGTVFEPDGAIILPDGALFVPPDAGATNCGPTEICGNGLDDNCNGQVDEGCPCTVGQTQSCYGGNPAQAGIGICTMGTQACVRMGDFGGWGPCMGDGRPQPVVCGGHMDYQCDGLIDEGCGCSLGATQGCYTGPPATRNIGNCRDGTQTCVETSTGANWGSCTGQTLPAPMNSCDGMDRMCTGMPFAGCTCAPGDTRMCYDGPAGTEGVGTCQGGTQTCALGANGPAWGPCTGEVLPAPNNPCDGLDHLCNHMPFQGCACSPGTTRPCYDGPAGTATVGLCRTGTQTCALGPNGPAFGACSGEVVPSPNNPCDGLDHLCNGMPFQGCACHPGDVRSCYDGPNGTAGVGLCRTGTQACALGANGPAWGPCSGEVVPGMMNPCDGLDHLCDGMPWTGCACTPGTQRSCYDGPANTVNVGLCHAGTQNCALGANGPAWSPCAGEVTPAPNNPCDGIDHMCNNMPLAGCACTIGAMQSCYDGPMNTVNVGLCRAGMQSCVVVNGMIAWSPCGGEVLPAPDTCDGVDRQCDGMPLNGTCGCVLNTTRPCYDGPLGTAGVGVCHGGTETCLATPAGGSAWGACIGEVIPSPDDCDGIDRLCNGSPLAGCVCQVGQTRPCYDGTAGTAGVGTCHAGTQTCVQSGGGSAWGSCVGEVVPAPHDQCSPPADTNCNGVVGDGCNPVTISCPADVSTPAGIAVNLTAAASSPGFSITGYSWTITAAPTGGIGTPNQWTPNPPSAATEQFLAYIVGVYTLQITAQDSGGHSASCSMHVTALGHGFRAELTWDGAGDVDLHVHDGNTGAAWYTFDDVYWNNKTPQWDAANPVATADNPSLDFDNTTADGPENTTIDFPVIGETYTVGVHNYTGAAGRIATIQLFCGSVTSPTRTFVSVPLSGPDVGNCTTNTFWKVATVTFTSSNQCTITPINTYGQSSDRCNAF